MVLLGDCGVSKNGVHSHVDIAALAWFWFHRLRAGAFETRWSHVGARGIRCVACGVVGGGVVTELVVVGSHAPSLAAATRAEWLGVRSFFLDRGFGDHTRTASGERGGVCHRDCEWLLPGKLRHSNLSNRESSPTSPSSSWFVGEGLPLWRAWPTWWP